MPWHNTTPAWVLICGAVLVTVAGCAGDPKEAARLERRALFLRPNDTFMRRQLEMFETNTKPQRHEGTEKNPK